MESTGFPRGKSLTFMVDFQCVVAHMYRSIDRFDASVYICIWTFPKMGVCSIPLNPPF